MPDLFGNFHSHETQTVLDFSRYACGLLAIPVLCVFQQGSSVIGEDLGEPCLTDFPSFCASRSAYRFRWERQRAMQVAISNTDRGAGSGRARAASSRISLTPSTLCAVSIARHMARSVGADPHHAPPLDTAKPLRVNPNFLDGLLYQLCIRVS